MWRKEHSVRVSSIHHWEKWFSYFAGQKERLLAAFQSECTGISKEMESRTQWHLPGCIQLLIDGCIYDSSVVGDIHACFAQLIVNSWHWIVFLLCQYWEHLNKFSIITVHMWWGTAHLAWGHPVLGPQVQEAKSSYNHMSRGATSPACASSCQGAAGALTLKYMKYSVIKQL